MRIYCVIFFSLEFLFSHDIGHLYLNNSKSTLYLTALRNVKQSIIKNTQITNQRDTLNQFIKNKKQVVANFSFPKVASINEIVSFVADSSLDYESSTLSYDWIINKNILNGKNIEFKFNKAGKYKIRLRVSNITNVNKYISEITKEIKINEPPKPYFGLKSIVAIGEIVNLDASKSIDLDGAITQYEWRMSDGAILKGIKEKYFFSKEGIFTISLNIKDDDNAINSFQTLIKTIRVNAQPKANAGPDFVSNSANVKFSALNSFDQDDVALDFEWDFGDGEKSNKPDVNHVYKIAQTYRSVLKVKDRSGAKNNTDFDTMYVRINQRPIVQTLNYIITEANQAFTLDAFASKDPDGSIENFEWILNQQKQNGASSHFSFSNSGNYQVELIITDNDGAIDRKFINIFVNSSPTAKIKQIFRIAPNDRCSLDASDSFDSDGKIIEYRWAIEDQPDLFGKKIETRFNNPGRYLVTLFVKDNNNALNSISQYQQIVEVNFPPNSVVINDILTDKQFVEYNLNSIKDPDGDNLNFIWNFGDGETGSGQMSQHFYKSKGTYPVSVTIDDGKKLKNSSITLFFKTIVNSKPIAKITAKSEAFAGETILFNGLNSVDADNDLLIYKWDFDDGEFANEMNPIHKFIKPGQYSVRLTVKDNSLLENQESFSTHFINILNAPVAIAGEDQDVCAQTVIYFDGSKSSGWGKPIKSFEWDFGDGEKGGGLNPTHVFKTDGIFNVRLTVTIEGIGQTSSTDDLIVRVSAAPKAEFKAKPEACIQEFINFDASLSSTNSAKIIEYIWEMGNGEKQIGKIINYAYPKEGIYTVTLHIKTNENNLCNTAFVKQFIRINKAPKAEIIATASTAKVSKQMLTIYENDYVYFNAEKSFDPDGKIYKYTWLINNTRVSQEVTFYYLFSEIKNNSVVLIVQDYSLTNCRDQKDSIMINVIPTPDLEIETPLRAWVNEKINFSSNLINTKWLCSDGHSELNQNLQYSFSKAGVYSISAFSAYSQKKAFITILELPKLSIPDSLFLISGDSLNVMANLEEEIIEPLSFEWSINGELFFGQKINTKVDQLAKQNLTLTYNFVSSYKEKKLSRNIPIFIYPKLQGEIMTDIHLKQLKVARNEILIGLKTENEDITVNWLINNEKFAGPKVIYELKNLTKIKIECFVSYSKLSNKILTLKKEIIIK